MKVYVVFYDVELPRGRDVDTERRIDSVFKKSDDADARILELQEKYKFYADYDTFNLE